MSEKSDILRRAIELQTPDGQELRREEIRNALLRLREIGQSLPPVDAVAIVREGRDLTDRGSH